MMNNIDANLIKNGTIDDLVVVNVPDKNVGDLISRQAAIEAIDRYYKDKRYITRSRTILSAICLDMKSTMDSLPSEQPEIIHCKECKYGVQDEDKRWYCRGLGCQVGEADGSGFCADAERRTDE